MKLIKNFWPSFVWTLVIVFLSVTSGKSIPSADWMDWIKMDKWVHAFIYGVLFFLTFYGTLKLQPKKVNFRYWFYFNLLFTIFLGIAMELIQAYFLTDRFGEFSDAVANSFGALFAIFFIKYFYKKWPWQGQMAIDNEGTV